MARAIAPIGIERLRGDEIDHLGVLRGRLEILAHRQEIDVGAAHVVHHLMNLEPLLAQPEHDARLGEDQRIVALDLFEQAQRGIVARARADRRIEPRHGFEVVVVDVGPGGDDRLDRRLASCCGNRGSGSRSWWRALSRRSASITLHELARSAIGQIVAIDRGDDDVLKPELAPPPRRHARARSGRPRAASRS